MAKCAICKDDDLSMVDFTRFREVKGRRIINVCGGCMDDLYGGSE